MSNITFKENGEIIINNFENPWNGRNLWCSNLNINTIKNILGNNINNIIEFGSYDGGDGIKYKHYFPNANVYSIEASPNCYKNMLPLKSYGLNIFNYAIRDFDGEIDFYQTYDQKLTNYAPCGSVNIKYCSIGQGQDLPLKILPVMKVFSKKLKTFCQEQNIQNIDLLHIDVEGHGLSVIKGMEDLNPRMIYIEVKSDTHDHSKEIETLLIKYNYKKILSLGSDEVYILN